MMRRLLRASNGLLTGGHLHTAAQPRVQLQSRLRSQLQPQLRLLLRPQSQTRPGPQFWSYYSTGSRRRRVAAGSSKIGSSASHSSAEPSSSTSSQQRSMSDTATTTTPESFQILPPSSESDSKVSIGYASMKPSKSDSEQSQPASDSAESDPEGYELSRYYNYLDTQYIYSNLHMSGFDQQQAESLMHIIRDLLSLKLALIREKGNPTSAAENEAYLFEAACSEIRSDIQISRQAQADDFRAQVARLLRDGEILQQEVAELLSSLKSEVEMDINERKNSTRADESSLDLRIQEVDNRITIDIISDLKSQVEQLRWQTTRRGLVAVLIVAASILFATSFTRKEEKPRKVSSPVPAEEIQVPVLAPSEEDDYPVDDRSVGTLGSGNR